MGYDTKPNLDKSKFEQKNTDILNLSGSTRIYNSFTIESGATFTIKSNAGVGKALISDSGGTITLQSLPTLDDIVHGNNIYTTLTTPVGITTASNNVLLGCDVGDSLTQGCHNIGIGCNSLKANTIGNNNIAYGRSALFSNISGNNNLALGSNSLYSNTVGSNNIAIGLMALSSNNSSYNIAIGEAAMTMNSAGMYNIGIGYDALRSNVSGYSNIGIGFRVDCGDLCGYNNIGIGDNALANNISGSSNIALGWYALSDIAGGTGNIAIGNSTRGGNATNVNCRLYIGNDPYATGKHLIYGEFDNEKLCIRGKTYISGLTNASKTKVLYYDESTKEVSYGNTPSGTGGTSYGFNNGLTESGGVVSLGGVLDSEVCLSSISGCSYVDICLCDDSRGYVEINVCDIANLGCGNIGVNPNNIALYTYDGNATTEGSINISNSGQVGLRATDNSLFGTTVDIYTDGVSTYSCDCTNYRYGSLNIYSDCVMIGSYDNIVSCSSEFLSSPTNLSLYVYDNSSHQSSIAMNGNDITICSGCINLHAGDTSNSVGVCFTCNSINVGGTSEFSGITYSSDYSSFFGDRSLVDKAYVISLITGNTGNTGTSITYNNGLTKSNDIVSLGGTLTRNTTICTAGNDFYICGGVKQVTDKVNIGIQSYTYMEQPYGCVHSNRGVSILGGIVCGNDSMAIGGNACWGTRVNGCESLIINMSGGYSTVDSDYSALIGDGNVCGVATYNNYVFGSGYIYNTCYGGIFGRGSINCSNYSTIIGSQNNNIICCNSCNTVLIGAKENTTINSSGYTNTTIVNCLALLETPSCNTCYGYIMMWNDDNKKVEKITTSNVFDRISYSQLNNQNIILCNNSPYLLLVDTTSSAVTVCLQSSAFITAGKMFKIKDAGGCANANSITVCAISGSIENCGSTYIINNNYGMVELIYSEGVGACAWKILSKI